MELSRIKTIRPLTLGRLSYNELFGMGVQLFLRRRVLAACPSRNECLGVYLPFKAFLWALLWYQLLAVHWGSGSACITVLCPLS